MNRHLLAQGAIECCCGSTAGTCRGQGATEYLVLLAVVLIIALVSIALLGFFPGMATDAQITESQIYWRSASPIQISEIGNAQYGTPWGGTVDTICMRVRNTGTYPITITKLLGAGNETAYYYDGAGYSLLSIQLAPGQEAVIGSHQLSSPCNTWSVLYGLTTSTPQWSNVLYGATSRCSSSGGGTLTIKNFGFEYTTRIENQQIIKRQIGKDVVTRCGSPM